MGVARHQQLRDEAGPARLMRGTDAAAGVAVEVFVEEHVIAKMRVLLQSRVMCEHRAVASLIREKDPCEAHGELVRHFVDRHEMTRTGRTLNAEVVAEVVMKLLQRLDDEKVHREPDRAAPVGVAAEQRRVGLRWCIAHREIQAVHPEHVGLALVHLRHRAHAEVGEELVRVEHAHQQLLHAMSAQQRQQATLAATGLIPMGHELREVGSVAQKPFEPRRELGHALQQLGL